jgi:hypothetical protein
MTSKPFNKRLMRQKNVGLEQKPVQVDTWEKKIEGCRQVVWVKGRKCSASLF